LTSFIRIFCQHAYIGGWRTRQARSYFAVPLPHRWWLWGIDIQLSTYIDAPQLDYFHTVADKMGPGDRVILCVAEPSWVDAADNVAAFRNLAYVERHLIAPTARGLR
jgi:hypothetical protein